MANWNLYTICFAYIILMKISQKGKNLKKVENEENINFVISLSQKFQIWIQHIQYCKIWFQAGFVFLIFLVSEHFCA